MYTEPNMKFNFAAMKKHHEICQNFLWVFLFLETSQNFCYQIKRNVYGQMNGWLDGQHETYRDPNLHKWFHVV